MKFQFNWKSKNQFLILTIAVAVFITAFAISGTLTIGFALSSVSVSMILVSQNRAVSRKSWQLFNVIPEIVDFTISGIQSGLSLTESLSNLGERGPEISRPFFIEFKSLMNNGNSFEKSVSYLQDEFSIRAADQLFESLIFAKNLGGTDLLALLRQLGDFTRQDLSLRREIAAKQGWIRNSAHLSAAAPWILLLLLSAQPSTGSAFTTPQGTLVLGFAVAMTTVAYLWMGKLSQLPEPPRIFGVAHAE